MHPVSWTRSSSGAWLILSGRSWSYPAVISDWHAQGRCEGWQHIMGDHTTLLTLSNSNMNTSRFREKKKRHLVWWLWSLHKKYWLFTTNLYYEQIKLFKGQQYLVQPRWWVSWSEAIRPPEITKCRWEVIRWQVLHVGLTPIRAAEHRKGDGWRRCTQSRWGVNQVGHLKSLMWLRSDKVTCAPCAAF